MLGWIQLDTLEITAYKPKPRFGEIRWLDQNIFWRLTYILDLFYYGMLSDIPCKHLIYIR